ncbi:MAG: HEAT repeat domain-containing protein [Candidatus Wallbacteria bacterium]|nr:HEAT repeat domain-containing protein [Candidatus Wallbacteria bacterium]
MLVLLGKIGGEEDILIIAKNLKHQSAQVRINAVEAFKGLKSPMCFDYVLPLLSDSEVKVRIHTAEYLFLTDEEKTIRHLENILKSGKIVDYERVIEFLKASDSLKVKEFVSYITKNLDELKNSKISYLQDQKARLTVLSKAKEIIQEVEKISPDELSENIHNKINHYRACRERINAYQGTLKKIPDHISRTKSLESSIKQLSKETAQIHEEISKESEGFAEKILFAVAHEELKPDPSIGELVRLSGEIDHLKAESESLNSAAGFAEKSKAKVQQTILFSKIKTIEIRKKASCREFEKNVVEQKAVGTYKSPSTEVYVNVIEKKIKIFENDLKNLEVKKAELDHYLTNIATDLKIAKPFSSENLTKVMITIESDMAKLKIELEQIEKDTVTDMIQEVQTFPRLVGILEDLRLVPVSNPSVFCETLRNDEDQITKRKTDIEKRNKNTDRPRKKRFLFILIACTFGIVAFVTTFKKTGWFNSDGSIIKPTPVEAVRLPVGQAQVIHPAFGKNSSLNNEASLDDNLKRLHQKTCIPNLRTLESALEMFLMDNAGKANNIGQLIPYLVPHIGNFSPECPDGGSYSIKNEASSFIECSIHGSLHNLREIERSINQSENYGNQYAENKGKEVSNDSKNSKIRALKTFANPIDMSLTLGQAMDTYPYFENVSWDNFISDRGRDIVQVRCKIDFEKTITAHMEAMQNSNNQYALLEYGGAAEACKALLIDGHFTTYVTIVLQYAYIAQVNSFNFQNYMLEYRFPDGNVKQKVLTEQDASNLLTGIYSGKPINMAQVIMLQCEFFQYE